MSDNLVVVGAGHATGQLVVSLRQSGFTGSISVIGDEALPPYQRPPISKKYLAGELEAGRQNNKPPDFYAANDIDLRLNTRVTSIDRQAHTVSLDDGTTLPWDKLVLATGSRARRLDNPGHDKQGIHYLRSTADVDAIRADFEKAQRMTIIGGGYIGLEVAAVAVKHGLEVHVVEHMDRLLSRVVSPAISDFYQDVHQAEGVHIHLNNGVVEFHGDARVSSMSLVDGDTLATDLVVIGIGVIPNTELAEACGLACDNGIVVDEFSARSEAAVRANGDCTNHPNPLLGRRLRLESVPNALEQAKTAAATLCGESRAYAQVPWFWSDQYDLKLQIVGLTDGYDQTVIRGDMSARQFSCFYLREDRLIAVDAVNSPREFMLSKAAVAAGAKIPAEVLADSDENLKDAASRWPGDTT